jgi:hypothetical protein
VDEDTEVKLDYMAKRMFQLMKNQNGQSMLPATAGELQACGTASYVPNGCENLLYAPITTHRFYRSGRTEIDQVLEGQIPVAPGSSVLLAQAAHPPWPTGCYSLRLRLANGGNNYEDVRIEWFLDHEILDTFHTAAELYNHDGTLIGKGELPVPLAAGQHCCVGGNNRLRVRIRHTGNANQIEAIRLFVHHGKAVACCSTCAMGRACDCRKSEH